MDCELCDILEKIHTKVYLKHPNTIEPFIILECHTCKVPMVVFLKHEEPSEVGTNIAVKLAMELFPDKKPDFRRRQIPEHPHFHMR